MLRYRVPMFILVSFHPYMCYILGECFDEGSWHGNGGLEHLLTWYSEFPKKEVWLLRHVLPKTCTLFARRQMDGLMHVRTLA